MVYSKPINRIKELKDVNIESFNDNHQFLAEELIVPNVDKCDTSRTNMFTSHINQALILAKTEFPKVFTNFENQVGHYSSGYSRTEKELTVIQKIIKNDKTYVLVVKDSDNKIGIITRKEGERITEYFGYKNNNELIDNKDEGDIINADSVLHYNTSYIRHENELNFGFGTNLKTLYIPYKGMTYEDAIVVSESASEKLASYNVEEIEININTNDFLVNTYGDTNNYKMFPDVGEEIVNGELLARRRINHKSILFDMSSNNLNKINLNTDTIFYSSGTVINIDVYSNADMDKLSNHDYYNQISKYLVSDLDYYNKIYDVLAPLKEAGFEFSDDANYMYKRSKDIKEERKWTFNNNDFDNIIIKFTIMRKQPLVIGSKITNRYGGKGVISAILPDSEMPTTKCGKVADVCCNPLGIINRLNPSQLFELEINMLSQYIIDEMKKMDSKDKQMSYLTDYVKSFGTPQGESMEKFYNSLDDKNQQDFIDSVFENGISIHQPPFYGNTSFEHLRSLYNRYNDFKPYEFEDIEEHLMMGEVYFMLLKHHPFTKFSARSASYLNLKNIPSKSTKYKNRQKRYSDTPIRVGEMEKNNLMLTGNIAEVERVISLYSSNQKDREKLSKTLLQENIFDLEKVELTGEESNTKAIFNTLLNCLGTEIVKEDKE